MPHNVDIADGDDNWLAWGRLVDYWIRHPDASRPTTVKEFNDALQGHNPMGIVVRGKAHGADDRAVKIIPYPDDPVHPFAAPIWITLPTARMLNDDIILLNAPGPYPLQSFYDMCYVAPVRRNNFTEVELKEIMLRRVGEYVINECM
jgi:hypothetical protein